MQKEFEGKTEKEAIDKAVEALDLNPEQFDVEILESRKKTGLFGKGYARIRVHTHKDEEPVEKKSIEPDGVEEQLIQYLETILTMINLPGTAKVAFRKENKIGLEIFSEHCSVLIGKKGKTLDAIQLLVNVYAGRIGSDSKIIIDAENYRERREENLVKVALKSAEQVRRTKGSRLLEPMNPFERRLVHTALNDYEDIDTVSEGDGLYKQIRIKFRRKG